MFASEERFFDNSDRLKKPSAEGTFTTIITILVKNISFQLISDTFQVRFFLSIIFSYVHQPITLIFIRIKTLYTVFTNDYLFSHLLYHGLDFDVLRR